jgi:hypothetical protein
LRAFLIAGLLALGTGCAALKPKPHDPGIFLLPPSAAGVEKSLMQSLILIKGTSRFEALAAIEVSPEALSVVGLGPLGNRLMGLRWDGKHLEQERDPHLPKDLPLELILRDLEIAFWPTQALKGPLNSKGYTLSDDASVRTVSQDGQVLIRIHYDAADRWDSPAVFENLGLGYSLEIHPIKDEP